MRDDTYLRKALECGQPQRWCCRGDMAVACWALGSRACELQSCWYWRCLLQAAKVSFGEPRCEFPLSKSSDAVIVAVMKQGMHHA